MLVHSGEKNRNIIAAATTFQEKFLKRSKLVLCYTFVQGLKKEKV